MQRIPYLLGHLQECVDQPRRRRIRLVQQRRDQAWYWLSQGVGKPEALERWLETHVGRQTAAAARREMARAGQDFRQPGTERMSVVSGRTGSVQLGNGRGHIKKKKK